MVSASVELFMDDAYFREFHRQWVATLGVGYRKSRWTAGASLFVSLLAAIVGWLEDIAELRLFALACMLIGATALVSLASRRAAWLKNCRSLPWYRRPLRIELRDGELVQVKSYPGDPRFQRAAFVVTPDGYLVRYVGSVERANSAVSTTHASIYIPHAAIEPPMSREEFLGSLR